MGVKFGDNTTIESGGDTIIAGGDLLAPGWHEAAMETMAGLNPAERENVAQNLERAKGEARRRDRDALETTLHMISLIAPAVAQVLQQFLIKG